MNKILKHINNIPCEIFNNNKTENLIFLHANAFPPKCYLPLMKKLATKYNIICPFFRPLWQVEKNNKLKSWDIFKKDTVAFLNHLDGDQYHIFGHSLGAHIAFRIVLENKEFIKKAILLDPVIFDKYFILFWNLIKFTNFARSIHPLIRASKNQKMIYNTHLDIFNKYRKKSIFKNFSDKNLNYFIEGLTKTNKSGKIELIFPKEWELSIYQTGATTDNYIYKNLKHLDKSTLIFYAGKTNLPRYENTIKNITSKSDYLKSIYLPKNTHLFPMEIPTKLSGHILDFFN